MVSTQRVSRCPAVACCLVFVMECWSLLCQGVLCYAGSDSAMQRCCGVVVCGVQCCAVLCCAVLCCAVLCCAVLCCAVQCCAVLCYAVLFPRTTLLMHHCLDSLPNDHLPGKLCSMFPLTQVDT